jgi:hypothetical protein
MELLGTALGRLRRTNHELSVLQEIGRLLAGPEPFLDRTSASLWLLKSSLADVGSIAFYRRSLYWEEYEAVAAVPGSPTQHPPIPFSTEILEVPTRIALADVDNPSGPVPGFLAVSGVLSTDSRLLLESVAHPLAEALARVVRQEEAEALARLKQSRPAA